MKKLFLGALAILTSSMVLAEDTKDFKEKHWLVAIGPVYTSQLQASGSGGTKYGITLGYIQLLSERLDMKYFYDGNFNTASQGKSAVTSFNVGFNVYTKDRGSDFSPVIFADVGYGGQNFYTEASVMTGVGLGINAFRTKEASFSFYWRRAYTWITATNVSSYPYIDQFMLAVNW